MTDAEFKQLAAHVRDLQKTSDQTHLQVGDLRRRASRINIFRPLRAMLSIRQLSHEQAKIEGSFHDLIQAFSLAIQASPSGNMGAILVSCLDVLRLSARQNRLENEWAALTSSLEQASAFAFAVFSLYVAAFSLACTVLLGLAAL